MQDFKILKQSELADEDVMLMEKARGAFPSAHAPYSSFQVAAALLLDNGVIVTGTNQENAAYPSGMCAERVALYTASSQYPGISIRRLIVVAARTGSEVLTPASCCGACRQVMLEFEQRQSKPYVVIMYHSKDEWVIAPSAESLLPFSFKKSNLDKPHLVD